MASLANIHPDTIYVLENDKKSVGIKLLKRLGEILDVDFSEYDERYNFAMNTKEILENIRNNLNMSRDEFAKHVEISRSTMENWFYGRPNISIKLFNQLKEKLGPDFYIK